MDKLVALVNTERIKFLRDDLAPAVVDIITAQRDRNEADAAHRLAKIEWQRATDQASEVESEVALVATIAGRIDGKNEAARALQLSGVLRESDAVVAARAATAKALQALASAETTLNEAQATYDANVNNFKATLAAAALETALLGALASLTREVI